MKRIILSALAGALCMFLVILALATHAAKKEELAEYIHDDYVSALQGECFLCGEGSGPITSLYWGEDMLFNPFGAGGGSSGVSGKDKTHKKVCNLWYRSIIGSELNLSFPESVYNRFLSNNMIRSKRKNCAQYRKPR